MYALRARENACFAVLADQAGRAGYVAHWPRDSENQPFVYVAVAGNQFGRRAITLGDSINGQTQVTTGLNPGDRVIGDGSLFLQFANSLQR